MEGKCRLLCWFTDPLLVCGCAGSNPCLDDAFFVSVIPDFISLSDEIGLSGLYTLLDAVIPSRLACFFSGLVWGFSVSTDGLYSGSSIFVAFGELSWLSNPLLLPNTFWSRTGCFSLVLSLFEFLESVLMLLELLNGWLRHWRGMLGTFR